MSFYRELADVVETLRQGKGKNKTCTLLIGAGCSATAGVPTAAKFVEIIKKDYPEAYKRATEKNYPRCMTELAHGQRRDLIAEYIDKAKTNWAHIAIAQLIKNGYVDRVLTTNFDQLLVKSCAMVGEFPATYDFAASQLFKPEDVPDQAIFYLHGQRTGFKLMNTDEECAEHSKLLAPIFEDAGKKRTWLVVGYSGECDPVFDHLAKVPRFDHHLYWIGYKDAEPSMSVRENLLPKGKYAHYVKGWDADTFFIKLAQELGCFPPDFIGSPFSHLHTLLGTLADYPTSSADSEVNIFESARRNITAAIKKYEAPVLANPGEQVEEDAHDHAENVSLQAAALFSAGKYEELIALAGELTPPFKGVSVDLLYWALVYLGDSLYEQAKGKEGEEQDRLFAEACNKYSEAVRINPSKDQAFNNWGNALSDQAEQKEGEERDKLFSEAYIKYGEAVRINPNTDTAFFNWGNALSDQAEQKEGEERDRLFSEAYIKYGEAVRINPNDTRAFDNWGIVLLSQAKGRGSTVKDQLLMQAEEVLLKGEAITTGSCSYNLACVHSLRGDEAECRKSLEKSLKAGTLPGVDHLTEDHDLNAVRGKEWFQELLTRVSAAAC